MPCHRLALKQSFTVRYLVIYLSMYSRMPRSLVHLSVSHLTLSLATPRTYITWKISNWPTSQQTIITSLNQQRSFISNKNPNLSHEGEQLPPGQLRNDTVKLGTIPNVLKCNDTIAQFFSKITLFRIFNKRTVLKMSGSGNKWLVSKYICLCVRVSKMMIRLWEV